MPQFLHQASDDQIALALCFGAVLVSGLIMHFSHHVGRLTGKIRLHETPDQTGLLLHEAQPVHSLQPAEAAVRERAA
ncbi:MAG: hypothetical protein ACM3U2_09855 [Deltaproteobacteria bacterium]